MRTPVYVFSIGGAAGITSPFVRGHIAADYNKLRASRTGEVPVISTLNEITVGLAANIALARFHFGSFVCGAGASIGLLTRLRMI